MRRLALVSLLIVAAAGAACGDDYHFHVAQEGEVNLRLGPVGPSCSDREISGVQNLDGSVTAYTHRMQSDACVVNATFRGPILDMGDMRAEAKGELHGDGDLEDTRIERFNLKLEAARLRDLENDNVLNISDLSMISMHATVDIGGEKALGIAFDTDEWLDDPDHPREFVADPTELVPQVNAAFEDIEEIQAVGEVQLRVDQDGLDGLVEASDPALVIEIQADFDGDRPSDSDMDSDNESIFDWNDDSD